MKRLGVLVVAVVLLAGCSSSNGAHPPSRVSTPQTAAGRFLALVDTLKYQEAGLLDYSNAQLLRTARQQCAGFSHLRTQTDQSLATGDLVRVDWGTVAAAALVHAASLTICGRGSR